MGDLNVPEESDTRMRPFILENVTPKMDIYREESFGPTVSLLTFDTEDEAVKIANDTDYGLSASVFTTDLATGFRVAKRIESGYVLSPFCVHTYTKIKLTNRKGPFTSTS